MGIDPGIIGRVFAAFDQGEASGLRRAGSLGLGLAISRAIMQMLGGGIEASSKGPGQGATFTLRLPVAHPEGAQPDQAAQPPGEARPVHILLVEDHESTRVILSRLLRRKGHTVHTAHDLASALAAGRNQRFDLLISDIGLPDGNGLDVMRWFQQYQQIPGIALSGYGMDADIQASREAGFQAHLVKPLDADHLIQAIERVVAAAVAEGI
jgi:CheY-like chemotaxis protein